MLNSSSISKETSLKLWALVFVSLNALDFLLTLFILNAGGSELNPLIRATLEIGTPFTAALKMGVSGLFAWFLYRLRREGALKLATVLILGVCLFNATGIIVGLPLT
jgi:hypothetical protein